MNLDRRLVAYIIYDLVRVKNSKLPIKLSLRHMSAFDAQSFFL